MALPAVSGSTVFASDLYQLCRPSGSTETGKYYLYSQTYAINATFSCYMQSQSRGATPVSVSVDEADHSHSSAGGNCAAPTTQLLTSNGFHIYTGGTGANTIAQVGGNFTIS